MLLVFYMAQVNDVPIQAAEPELPPLQAIYPAGGYLLYCPGLAIGQQVVVGLPLEMPPVEEQRLGAGIQHQFARHPVYGGFEGQQVAGQLKGQAHRVLAQHLRVVKGDLLHGLPRTGTAYPAREKQQQEHRQQASRAKVGWFR